MVWPGLYFLSILIKSKQSARRLRIFDRFFYNDCRLRSLAACRLVMRSVSDTCRIENQIEA